MNTTTETEQPKRKKKRRGNGEGTIFYREDRKCWSATISTGYDSSGKRKRKTVYGKTKTEVQGKLTRLQNKKLDGTLSDETKLTVAQYLERWLEDTSRPNVRESTLSSYRNAVKNHINPQVGGVKLAKLSDLHVSGILAEMERGGLSPRMRQLVYAVLRKALNHAVRSRVIPRNPCSTIDQPRVPETEINPLSKEEAQTFLEQAKSDRLSALYVLAVTTGMRQGELYGLQWDDVDLDSGSLSVRRTLNELNGGFHTGPPKTKRGRRKIELSEKAVDALHDHRKRMLAEGNAGSSYMFCDRKGGPLRRQNVQRRSFKPILENAELPNIRFHDLRHTAATLLLLAGVNPKVVQEMLGHSKVSVTLDIYSHVLPTMHRTAAEKMDAMFAVAETA